MIYQRTPSLCFFLQLFQEIVWRDVRAGNWAISASINRTPDLERHLHMTTMKLSKKLKSSTHCPYEYSILEKISTPRWPDAAVLRPREEEEVVASCLTRSWALYFEYRLPTSGLHIYTLSILPTARGPEHFETSSRKNNNPIIFTRLAHWDSKAPLGLLGRFQAWLGGPRQTGSSRW